MRPMLCMAVFLAFTIPALTNTEDGYYIESHGNLSYVDASPANVHPKQWAFLLYQSPGAHREWGRITSKTLTKAQTELRWSQSFERRYCKFFDIPNCPPMADTFMYPKGPVAIMDEPASLEHVVTKAESLHERFDKMLAFANELLDDLEGRPLQERSRYGPQHAADEYLKQLSNTAENVGRFDRMLSTATGSMQSELFNALDDFQKAVAQSEHLQHQNGVTSLMSGAGAAPSNGEMSFSYDNTFNDGEAGQNHEHIDSAVHVSNGALYVSQSDTDTWENPLRADNERNGANKTITTAQDRGLVDDITNVTVDGPGDSDCCHYWDIDLLGKFTGPHTDHWFADDKLIYEDDDLQPTAVGHHAMITVPSESDARRVVKWLTSIRCRHSQTPFYVDDKLVCGQSDVTSVQRKTTVKPAANRKIALLPKRPAVPNPHQVALDLSRTLNDAEQPVRDSNGNVAPSGVSNASVKHCVLAVHNDDYGFNLTVPLADVDVRKLTNENSSTDPNSRLTLPAIAFSQRTPDALTQTFDQTGNVFHRDAVTLEFATAAKRDAVLGVLRQAAAMCRGSKDVSE